jgi:hypothetical protein
MEEAYEKQSKVIEGYVKQIQELKQFQEKEQKQLTTKSIL